MSKRPSVDSGWLGEKPKFAELGLHAINYPDAEFKVVGKSEIKMKFKAPKAIKTLTKLKLCDRDKEYDEHVFAQIHDKVLSLIVNFPKDGFYKLELYALESSSSSNSLPGVFNFLIEVDNETYPFPKQFAQWADGCFLHYPMKLSPKALKDVAFKVVVPKAVKVALVVNDKWMQLDKKGGDTWQGIFDLSDAKGKKVNLNANFGGDETKYSTLLQYNV